MKVLCPVDFSVASTNAAKWVASFISQIGDSQLDLVHFIYVMRRAGIFVSVTSVLQERAEADMETLKESLISEYPGLLDEHCISKWSP